jgi:formamidopyrimidine-DNA glycosylase
MPELPEVETTVRGLKKILPGLLIKDIWSDYPLPIHREKEHIKSPLHYERFLKTVRGAKVKDVRRRGKNILIDLKNDHTVLIHMKMTGHFLYGKYRRKDGFWIPKIKEGPLRDPYNKFVRLVFSLSNGNHLVLSDLRKFGKVMVAKTKNIEHAGDLYKLGPELLEPPISFKAFRERLFKKPGGKIKQVLMDQSVVAGIGNIYSDEILWEVGVNPKEPVKNISRPKLKKMYAAAKKILRYSISLGGDSTSDYRNLEGNRGGFQNKHHAYHKMGQKCLRKNCGGMIVRIKLGARSAHFCNRHQRLLGKGARVL